MPFIQFSIKTQSSAYWNSKIYMAGDLLFNKFLSFYGHLVSKKSLDWQLLKQKYTSQSFRFQPILGRHFLKRKHACRPFSSLWSLKGDGQSDVLFIQYKKSNHLLKKSVLKFHESRRKPTTFLKKYSIIYFVIPFL